MTEPRLAAGIEVSALLAQARSDGGFGTVIRRGDAERGSLLILLAERGNTRFLLQRLLQPTGSYAWEARGAGESEALARRVAQALDRDPDLWVIELDVPSPERFIADLA